MEDKISLYDDLVIIGDYKTIEKLGKRYDDGVLRRVFNPKSQDFCKTFRDAMSVIKQYLKEQNMKTKIEKRYSNTYGMVTEIYFNKR